MVKKPAQHKFHSGATGSVIWVRISNAQRPAIRSIQPSGLVELVLPDVSDTSRLLHFLAGVLGISIERLGIAAAGKNAVSGQVEKMVTITDLSAAETDQILLSYYHSAANK